MHETRNDGPFKLAVFSCFLKWLCTLTTSHRRSKTKKNPFHFDQHAVETFSVSALFPVIFGRFSFCFSFLETIFFSRWFAFAIHKTKSQHAF